MCDDLGSFDSMDQDVESVSDISAAACDTAEPFSAAEPDFEGSGIFDSPADIGYEGISDTPQDVPEPTADDDVYHANTLDETMILDENGEVHSVAERMAELERAEELQRPEAAEPYEAKTLDEIRILDEDGGIHTIADRMEELYGENPMGVSHEQLEQPEAPDEAGIESLGPTASQRIEYLTELKSSLLTGDQDTLELFGLEDPNADTEEGGDQKVKTR